MDPNLFHLDWERVLEVLAAIVVLAFLLERALAVVFESRLWVNSRMDRSVGKEAIALLLGGGICYVWKFDAVSMVILSDKTTLFGEILTGAVIAGGSKASIRLFRDWMQVGSSTIALKDAGKAAAKEAVKAQAVREVALKGLSEELETAVTGGRR